MICPNKSVCDGYPEQCDSCANNSKDTEAKYTVNNVNIRVSGGFVIQALLLAVVFTLLTPSFNYGSGKVHNITGVILPDTDSVHNITEVDKKA